MTRVLIDANVLISYLLNPLGESPPATTVRAAAGGVITPIVSPRLVHEVSERIATKPYLNARVPIERIDRLVRILIAIGELHDDADPLYPSISRDHKDDYLLANAVIYRADYLVTGDRDLLVIGEFEGVRIVSPAEFAEILDAGV